MKKYYNSFAGLIIASVILLAAVIFENIKGALMASENHFAPLPAAAERTAPRQTAQKGQTDSTALYPPTTPQAPQTDTSGIKKEIERAGLNPIIARFWKEVE